MSESRWGRFDGQKWIPYSKQSELASAVAQANAMEDALAAPLFDGVRAGMDAVLDGDDVEELRKQAQQWEEQRKRADALHVLWQQAEHQRFAAIQRAERAEAERDEARHAKAQAEQALARPSGPFAPSKLQK